MSQSEIDRILEEFPNSSPEMARIVKILDMKADIALQKTEENRKIIDSLDDRFVDLSEDNETVKENLRKEFYNSPNMDNYIESDIDYQREEGLTDRAIDFENPTVGEGNHVCVDFGDPKLQKEFYKIFKKSLKFNPSVTKNKLLRLLPSK